MIIWSGMGGNFFYNLGKFFIAAWIQNCRLVYEQLYATGSLATVSGASQYCLICQLACSWLYSTCTCEVRVKSVDTMYTYRWLTCYTVKSMYMYVYSSWATCLCLRVLVFLYGYKASVPCCVAGGNQS